MTSNAENSFAHTRTERENRGANDTRENLVSQSQMSVLALGFLKRKVSVCSQKMDLK